MLRITTAVVAGERRWTLCGRLTGPWVAELQSSWQQMRGASDDFRSVVDLTDVTFIDESGERLLQQMRNEGVQFVARGVETTDVIENLCAREKRPVRRFLACLEEMK